MCADLQSLFLSYQDESITCMLLEDKLYDLIAMLFRSLKCEKQNLFWLFTDFFPDLINIIRLQVGKITLNEKRGCG